MHELVIRLYKLIDECTFKVDITKEPSHLDILVHAYWHYEVKILCNAQPDDGDNKLIYEEVLRKAKGCEAAVREYNQLIEANPTMTFAFQQSKEVAMGAFKVKKQSSGRSWKRSTSGSRERQHNPIIT